MKQYISVFIVFFFVACTSNEPEPVKKPQKDVQKSKVYSSEIYDLKNLPQNVEAYIQNINFTKMSYINQEAYEKSYFSPWNMESVTVSADEAKWPFNSFNPQNSYGANLQVLGKPFFDAMQSESNFEEYATINERAITLRYTNIRAFPTSKPLFLDPKKAGEGFPFDYLQNSSIAANKPIFISHFSKSGEWIFVFSSFTYGWVKSSDIVILEKEHTNIWQNAQQIFLTREDEPLYSESGTLLYKSRIGTMLPLVNESEEFYSVLSISSREPFKPSFEKSKISKSIASKGILAFNTSNVQDIITKISKSKYGWGGLYNERDCSSMLRDMFAPFGVWLPRNSYYQSKVGEVISLENMENTQKIALIKKQAVPFKTLLYKKGHIMLYLGVYNHQIIIFHDTWGIKTLKDDKEGRIIIGKTVFSSLRLGSHQEFYDEESELLRNLKSMNILNY